MKCIIVGTQEITDAGMLEQALVASGWREEITEVVSGEAPGADALGHEWGDANGIPVTPMPAAWDDLSHPDAVIRVNRRGQKYDLKAGYRRNAEMAEYAKGGALLALWDGKSGGTKNMIEEAKKQGLRIYVYTVEDYQRYQRACAFLAEGRKPGHQWSEKPYQHD